MEKLSESARAAKNAYQSQWRKKNPDKIKQYAASYWERKAFSPETIETKVCNLHKQGMSLRDIAREIGVSHMTVKRILQ
jgi:DNA-binding NarL/FixJ family response regulator